MASQEHNENGDGKTKRTSRKIKVGDLVRVTGRPRDGWVPFLGIIVEVDGHQYKVRPVSHDKWVYALDKRDMELIDADK